nr:unnamed protein product [Callosobruchus chinensis]
MYAKSSTKQARKLRYSYLQTCTIRSDITQHPVTIIGRQRLKQLHEVRGGTVPPGRIVDDLGPAKGARLLAIEPGGDARFAEDVPALQQYRRIVLVVTDGAVLARRLDLILAGAAADALEID